MVLLNISTLSDEEIRYIAQQENIEGWESASRQDLIDEIQELYDEEDQTSESDSGLRHKFFNNISGEESDVAVLPGVEPVSAVYNKTYIHIIPKDLDWGYAFWEISENTEKEVTSRGGKILLRTSSKEAGKKAEESFDIEVSMSDRSWSIETSQYGRTYVLSLIAKYDDTETVLCTSAPYYKPKSWIRNNTKYLADPNTYRLLVRPLVSKDGSILADTTVREILKNA